jgi:tRNA pseudouridine38-40 synthase
LWQMIRIMVGTLVEVGIGRYGAADVQRMLQAKDRSAAGPTAPPHGLFLQWVRMREQDVAGPNGQCSGPNDQQMTKTQ